MSYLALDYGSKRVGVAISDPQHRMALPHSVLNLSDCFKAIVELVEKKSVTRVIVGLPRSLSGKDTPSTAAARNFAEQLKQHVSVPIVLYDERFTTTVALRQQRAAGIKDRQSRSTIDALAAAALLESYLAFILKQ